MRGTILHIGLLFFTHFLLSQNTLYWRVPDKVIHSSNFGLSPNLPECSSKLIEIFNESASSGLPIYINRPGVYNFTESIIFDSIDFDVDISACPGVIFKTSNPNPFLFIVRYDDISDSITYPITRGDSTLPGVSFSEGDILAIEQEKMIGAIGRGGDILKWQQNKFDKTFLFTTENVDSIRRARHYKASCINISNITFQSDSSFVSPAPFLLKLEGFGEATVYDVDFIGKTGQIVDGLNIYACSDTRISKNFSKKLRYPILMNLCSDVLAENGTVHDSRHYTTMSLWSRDIITENIQADSSTRTPIESHFAWNVTFRNITSKQTDQINLRAFGKLQIIDCDIESDNSYNGGNPGTDYSLIGYHFAHDQLIGTEYEWLLSGTNILIEGTTYEEDIDGKFRGLTATAFKSLTIRNCTTKCVGAYVNPNIGAQIIVDSSKFGHAYCRDGADNTIIKNSTIDGDLSTQDFIHSVSLSDSISFVNCTFINCDTKYLEENWQASGDPAIHGWFKYSNCQDTMKGLAKQATTGALHKHPFIFDTVTLRLLQDYPGTYAGQSIPTIIQLNSDSLVWDDFTLK